MNVSLNLIDAIIFDMDGTLWNASDSYAEVWNIALSHFGKKGHFTGSDMHPYMGMAIEDIMTGLLSEYEGLDHQEFLAKAMQIEVDLMPVRGGVPGGAKHRAVPLPDARLCAGQGHQPLGSLG